MISRKMAPPTLREQTGKDEARNAGNDVPADRGGGLFSDQAKQSDLAHSQPAADSANVPELHSNTFDGNTFADQKANAEIYAKARYSRGRGEQVKIRNAHDGTEIAIPWQGVRHALRDKVSPVALAAVHDLENLLRRAKPEGRPHGDKRGRHTIASVHYYDVPVRFDGKPKTLRFVVREHSDGKRYYDHFEIRQNESPSAGGDSASRRPNQIVEGPSDKSIAENPAPARSVGEVLSTLKRSPLGKPLAALEKAGILRIVWRPEARWNGAWSHEGQYAMLNAARLDGPDAIVTAFHKLGGHGGMREVIA
jgi:hypothetical protein